MRSENDGGERKDENQPRDDEAQPSDDTTHHAPEAPRAEDGQLSGRRARQDVRSGDAVLELQRRHPSSLFDAKAPQQGDVGGGSTEPDAPDPTPLPRRSCPVTPRDGMPRAESVINGSRRLRFARQPAVDSSHRLRARCHSVAVDASDDDPGELRCAAYWR